MMKEKVRQNWTPGQKSAVTDELEAHITEILRQIGRLNQEVQEKLNLVEQLTARLAGHCNPEDALPF